MKWVKIVAMSYEETGQLLLSVTFSHSNFDALKATPVKIMNEEGANLTFVQLQEQREESKACVCI